MWRTNRKREREAYEARLATWFEDLLRKKERNESDSEILKARER